jgi:hypothetical protein
MLNVFYPYPKEFYATEQSTHTLKWLKQKITGT